MKNIKRIITSFILVFSILFLSACGGVKSKTYHIEKDGREITVKVKHKDDNVNEIDIEARLSYGLLMVQNQEQAKVLFSLVKSMSTKLEGIKFEVDYAEKDFKLKVNVDVNKVDVNKVKGCISLLGEKVPKSITENVDEVSKKVKSFKELKETLLKAGFKEK